MSGVPHHLRADLDDRQIADALALRCRGLSYSSIAICLEHFHGARHVNGERVRKIVRAAGADPEPRHARGYVAKGTA